MASVNHIANRRHSMCGYSLKLYTWRLKPADQQCNKPLQLSAVNDTIFQSILFTGFFLCVFDVSERKILLQKKIKKQ